MLQLTAADALAQTFAKQSPRLNPRRVGWPSHAITALVYVAFVALVVQAFLRQGVLVWSVGVAYVLYDTALLIFTAIEIWPLRHGATAPTVDGPTPCLAVIVAARNEAAVIDVTIDRLAAQDGAPDLILIADDGSDDATAATLARYGLDQPGVGEDQPPGTRLAGSALATAPARRQGARAQRGNPACR